MPPGIMDRNHHTIHHHYHERDIVGILLTLVGVAVLCAGAALAYYGFSNGSDAKAIAGLVALAIGIATGITGLSMTTVDARSVGIETKGGKFVDVLKPGRHQVAPWADIEQWTTRNQTFPFKVPVRLANQSKADVSGTITWAVADQGADWVKQVDRVKQLWAAYKTFDDMKTKYAEPTARGAVGDVFNVYDPFTGQGTGSADNPRISNAEWSKRVTAAVDPLYAKTGLTLVLVQVTDVDYDDETEKRIQGQSQKVMDTRNAEQDVELAKKQAQANAERAATAKSCNELMIYLAQTNQLQNLPPAFNCGATTGGGTIVNGATK